MRPPVGIVVGSLLGLLSTALGRSSVANDGGAAGVPVGRDPFAAVPSASAPALPLLQVPLEDLCLVALLWGIEPPHGLLQDRQGMGYIVRPGAAIGSRRARVRAITPQGLVMEEPAGPARIREFSLAVGDCPAAESSP